MQMIAEFLARLIAFLTGRSGAPAKKVATGWLAIALAVVAPFEGLRTVAYRDPVGIPTICFGETRGVQMGDTATRAECEAMLEDRLQEFHAGLAKCLPGLPTMPPEVQAAFVSWAYNIGTGAACKSTLVKKARAGDLRGACNELPKWDKARVAGKLVALPGLTRRRAEEQALCLSAA